MVSTIVFGEADPKDYFAPVGECRECRHPLDGPSGCSGTVCSEPDCDCDWCLCEPCELHGDLCPGDREDHP